MSQSVSMHTILIQQAARWLAAKGNSVVITDMSHGGSETADAIGWKSRVSTLIECKASRADFLADRHKMFRRMPERGMGGYRYYCAPAGMLQAAEIPSKWGLLEMSGRGLREVVKPQWHGDYSADQEVSLLTSALRRVAHVSQKGISVKVYTMDSLCRATLGISAPDLEWEI